MNQTNNQLTIVQILSRSYQELRNRFATFFVLPCGLAFLTWLFSGVVWGFSPWNMPKEGMSIFLSLVLSSIIFISGMWVLAALVLLVCKREDTPLKALAAAAKPCVRLIGGMLLLGCVFALVMLLLFLVPMLISYGADADAVWPYVLGIISLVLFFVFAICASIYFLLLPYTIVLRGDKSILQCFAFSFHLVKGYFWKTLGLLVIVSLINMALMFLSSMAVYIGFILAMLTWPALTVLFSLALVPVNALAMLILQIPLIALYVDRLPSEGGTVTNEDEDDL